MLLRISCYWLTSDIGEQKRKIKATLCNSDLTKMAPARRKNGEASPSPMRDGPDVVAVPPGGVRGPRRVQAGLLWALCQANGSSGSGQKSEDIFCPVRVGKLMIRGGRNWIKLNGTDIAVMVSFIPARWGPKQKD